jgi:Flp pilus assembly protein TadD
LILVANTIADAESEQGNNASIPMSAPANPKKKKKLWLILSLVVLLFGLGAGYFFVIRSNPETPTKPVSRSTTVRGKLTKPTPETQKAQAQPVDSTSAVVDKTVAEKGRNDSTRTLHNPIIENMVGNETKETRAINERQKNEETKEIKEPKLAIEMNENNRPVKGEFFEDTLKGQRDTPEKTPAEQTTLAYELGSERGFSPKALKVEEKSDFGAQAYYEKGVSYQRQRKFNQAIDSYKKALALNPDYQQACVKLASVLMQTGKFEEAKAQLNLLRVLMPDDQKIFFNLGLISYKLGQYSDAQDKIQQLLNINPFHLEACLLLASIFEEKGEMKKAVELYRQAHGIDINDPTAIYNLARTLDLSGDRVEASKDYQLYLNSNVERDVELELAVRKRLNFLLLQLGEK